MVLNMNRATEKSKMEKKERPEEKSPELIASEQKNKLLLAQLNKLSADQESLSLEKEAEKMAKETAALEQEADLRKALGDEFSTVKAGLKEGEELSNDQMIAIMAEAVGASSDAQGKLILNKVAAMMSKSDAEIKKTQNLLIEFAAATSMNQTRSAHSDYDDYKTEIAGIMSTTRGLSPERAYLLAKAEKSKGQPDQRRVETERPGEPPTPSALSSRDDYTRSKEVDNTQQLSPKAAFTNAVSAAIDKTLASRKG